MPYKQKPNKAVLKRFKVTKTGKLKRHHSKTSHLMSARTPALKRKLRRSGLVSEGFAKKYRKMAVLAHLKPKRTAHQRALKAQEAAATVAQ